MIKLILILAVLAVVAGLLLQKLYPDDGSRQFILGARCLVGGAAVGLLALGWTLYSPAVNPDLMQAALALGGLAFVIGLLGLVAMMMSPTGGSDDVPWVPWLFGGGAVVGLFALGWFAASWAHALQRLG